MSGIRLRTADPADRDAVIDLIQILNAHEDAVTGDRRIDRTAAADYYALLTERLARHQGRLVLAEDGGRAIALIGWGVQEDEPYIRDEVRHYGYVTDLVVHEDWRRRGVGAMLLAEAERLTRERGLKRLSIGVLAGNHPADASYRAFGFRDHLRVLVKALD